MWKRIYIYIHTNIYSSWCCLVTKSCPILSDPMDCSTSVCSVHGILQARILEWVDTSSSTGCFQPRDWTLNPHLLHWQAGSLPLSHQGSIYTHTHTHIHMYIPTYIHIYTHIYTHVCVCIYTHTLNHFTVQPKLTQHYKSTILHLVAQMVKNLPAMQETPVWSLGWENPLEKGMATYFSILAWRIPWTEEPGGLHSTESQRVRHPWMTNILQIKK